jgi:hypothetical protein
VSDGRTTQFGIRPLVRVGGATHGATCGSTGHESRVGPAELHWQVTAASEFHVSGTGMPVVVRSVCRPSIVDHPGHGGRMTASGPRRAGPRPLPVAARSVTSLSVIFKLTSTPLAGDSQGTVL